MVWHRQAIFKSKGDKLSSSAECRIWTQRVSGTESPADWMPADKPTELSRIKLKTWTQQPVPMISEHSAYSTPLPFGFRTWLWRYTCLLLLISMVWHRQAIFKSKGDKLSSSAECRIWTRVFGTESPTDWMVNIFTNNLWCTHEKACHNKITYMLYGTYCTSNIHYSDVIMRAMVSQITSLTIVYSTVYSGADQRKHQDSTSLAFVQGIHRWPVNSPHKWPEIFSIWWSHHECNDIHFIFSTLHVPVLYTYGP